MNTSHSSNQRVIEKCRFLILLMMNIFLPIPHLKSGYLLWYMLHEENTNKKLTIRPRYRIVQSMNSWLIMKQSKVPAESDGKPVDELDNRGKDRKTLRSWRWSRTRSSWGSAQTLQRKMAVHRLVFYELVKETGKPSTDVLPKKRLTTATSLSYALYSLSWKMVCWSRYYWLAMIHSSEIFTFARVERISLEAMVSSG